MKKLILALGILLILAALLVVALNSTPDYTNVLSAAIDESGAIYNADNTPGYRVHTRISSTGERAAANWCVTGYIPIRAGDVIRFRDLEYLDVEGKNGDTSRTGIYAYDSEFNEITHVNHSGENLPGDSWLAEYNSDKNVESMVMTGKWGESVAYIRICCSDLNSRSVITINEPITGDSALAFLKRIGGIFEKKAEYVPAASEPAQKSSSAEGTDKKASQNDRVDGEAVKIPEYWLEPLRKGAEEINTALCEAGANKSAFLYYTDAHWTNNSQSSPMLLRYLYKHTGMTKTIFGGDIVHTEGTDYQSMNYLWEWRSQIKDLPNHHSVVGNHDDGNTTDNLFTEDYIYGYLLAPEETPDIVRGNQGLYYYIDNAVEKTRYLYLDTAYRSVYYDPVQVQFVVDALETTPDNWHIVVVAHIWHDTNYGQEIQSVGDLSQSGAMLLNLFDEYNGRESGAVTVDVAGTPKIPYDFADNGGKVEFCVGGHTHWDYTGASEGGIPVILCETDSFNVRSGLEYKRDTATESSVNGIVADYDAGKIHVIKVGRGTSRVIPCA